MERTPSGQPVVIRNNNGETCDTCRVELLEENEEAAQTFMATRGQVITVGEKVVDLSIPAVQIIMDQRGVKDQQECMGKIMRTFHHFLKQQGGGDAG